MIVVIVAAQNAPNAQTRTPNEESMPKKILKKILLTLMFALPVCGAKADEKGGPVSPVDFNTQVRPIFVQYCAECHGGVKQAGDLSFVYAEQVLPPEGWVIEPGDPDASTLIERLKSDDPDLRMPPPDEHPDPVPDDKIALLERWIAEGANWSDPWSIAPLVESADLVSEAADDWSRQPLDRLVARRLADQGLSPSPDAEPLEWLRRVSFDLTGLPPSLDQARAFARACQAAVDTAQRDAVYAQQVDQLLASEAYGERWAAVWMDLARYADSKGYEKDPHRDMWPYRDWLIRAFNSDLPYDEFTIKQLAGDLLDNPTADDLIATAFHRNTQTNTEGGTDDEEFRLAAVMDRVSTTWTVWQATTFGCVQCHAHPYDPYRQEEYYACLAIFNNTRDADLDSDFPTLKIPRDANALESAVAAQLSNFQARDARNRFGRNVADDVNWIPLTPRHVSSSGGRLRIDGDQVRADAGTFPPGVTYTVDTDLRPMTAIKIEILPESDDPLKWPERGSVLTHVELSIVNEDGSTTPVPIADVFADAITADHDPGAALDKKRNQGVGGYPKLHGPRWAVFALAQRLTVGAGDRLRLQMGQSATVTGNRATHLRRFRWSASDDDVWVGLVGSEELKQLTDAVVQTKAAADAIRGAQLPVMLPYPNDVARSTRLFIRGNWLDRAQQVAPGIPKVFQRDDGSTTPVTNRLELARWLVSKENPLAARVAANRIWAQLFGLGIVETLEDFGSSGLQPSNVGLLDHLAARFRDQHRWRLKPMLREIVLSSTYRQSNRVSQAMRDRDPRNQLLSRGPRTRLSAEMIRDQALAVSGLLSDDIGGPSVMPHQPEGIWQTVYSATKWVTADPPQRYRRALYTYWRRTSPYPSFLMFDSPTRDLCSARRVATNTPLQALVLLNDPVYVECAEALAERAIRQYPSDLSSAIAWMYEAVVQRPASEADRRELESLYADLGAIDSAESKQEATLNSKDEHRETESGDPANVPTPAKDVAMVAVASTILNLDRALTK